MNLDILSRWEPEQQLLQFSLFLRLGVPTELYGWALDFINALQQTGTLWMSTACIILPDPTEDEVLGLAATWTLPMKTLIKGGDLYSRHVLRDLVVNGMGRLCSEAVDIAQEINAEYEDLL